MSNKKTVFSGMRATGRLHLGNYLGGAKGMIALQEDPEYETYYMVVDVHAITTPYDRDTLKKVATDVIIDYLACGLDPEKSVITRQSLVPQHTEMAFYLSSFTTIAKMQHLPTFKEKVKQHPDAVNMALLNYPILMAADIMAYRAGLVPVGIDQEPHLEVTREIAKKVNAVCGEEYFPEPKRFATKGEYVPSLLGEGKMSKSIEGSYITLMDDLETIKKRLAKVPTDAGKGADVPTAGGVANLLKLAELFEGIGKRTQLEEAYTSEGLRYSDIKEELAQAIYKELEPIQVKRAEIIAKPAYVEAVIQAGAERARAEAQKNLDYLKEKMGF